MKVLSKEIQDYVNSCNDENFTREQLKNALAHKLYNDLDCEKTEGFAQFCYYTAIEVLDGKFDSLEEIQAELSLILEETE